MQDQLKIGESNNLASMSDLHFGKAEKGTPGSLEIAAISLMTEELSPEITLKAWSVKSFQLQKNWQSAQSFPYSLEFTGAQIFPFSCRPQDCRC